MKIAIIAHSVFPIVKPYRGGLEKFIHVLATELSNKGIDVTLYCHKDSEEGPYKKKVFTDFDCKFDNNFDELNHDYKELLEELKTNNYDLIHNNSLNNDLLTLSNYNTPLLTTIHVPPIDGFREAVYNNFCNKNAYTNIISNSCLKTWDAFENCKVIHNGINVDEWNSNLGERQGAVWFGRICPEKGVENAIEASVKANLRLTVAGCINNQEYFDYLNKKYKGQFDHVGLCNHKTLNNIIASSKVFIKAPVWKEPFGLVYLESLACGTPIATYKTDISLELLNSKVACLTKDNPEGLSKGVVKASKFNNYSYCRQYVKDNFDISKMISNYVDYYKEILKCAR